MLHASPHTCLTARPALCTRRHPKQPARAGARVSRLALFGTSCVYRYLLPGLYHVFAVCAGGLVVECCSSVKLSCQSHKQLLILLGQAEPRSGPRIFAPLRRLCGDSLRTPACASWRPLQSAAPCRVILQFVASTYAKLLEQADISNSCLLLNHGTCTRFRARTTCIGHIPIDCMHPRVSKPCESVHCMQCASRILGQPHASLQRSQVGLHQHPAMGCGHTPKAGLHLCRA
jgi:hypothetical protein